MAQAPAELRHPAAPGAPSGGGAPPGRADDLLSQLAGTEIDRLLADADPDDLTPAGDAGRDRRPQARPSPAGRAGAGSAASRTDPPPGTRGGAGEEANDEPPAPEPAAALADANDTLAKELDQVFDRQLDDAQRGRPAEPSRPSVADGNGDGGGGGESGMAAEAAVSGEAARPAEATVPPEPAVPAGGVVPAQDAPPAVRPAVGEDPTGAGLSVGVPDLLSRLSAGERPPPPEPSTQPESDTAHGGNGGNGGSDVSHDTVATDTAKAPMPADSAGLAAPTAGIAAAAAPADVPAAAAAAPAPATAEAVTVTAHAASPGVLGGHGDTPHGDAAAAVAATTVVLPDPPLAAGPTWADRLLALAAVPLDPFPDDVRDVVGKVAIVTAVNGVAVLIYVLFVRG